MKTIPLVNGGEAKVDDEDYEFLMQWKWYNLDRHAVTYDQDDVPIYMEDVVMQRSSQNN